MSRQPGTEAQAVDRRWFRGFALAGLLAAAWTGAALPARAQLGDAPRARFGDMIIVPDAAAPAKPSFGAPVGHAEPAAVQQTSYGAHWPGRERATLLGPVPCAPAEPAPQIGRAHV